jgi:glycosyltransferase involved in cell wall biosynthesis
LVQVSAVTPRLSVVVACRDAQDVLGVQLAALARQQCPVPWELLICDNGSTDGTVPLALSWADRLPLRIVDASGIAGAGPARNAGARQARGEWIGFCDADDEVGEGWLSALCTALSQHRFVAGRFEGTRLNSPRTLRSRTLDQQDGLQSSSPDIGLPHAGAGNLGIHRSVFDEVGGFDPAVRYLQDTDLCWRVQLAGYDLVFIHDLVVHVRLRSTLRGMYRQGRNYGASQASLERRYAGAAARLRASKLATVGSAESQSDDCLLPEGDLAAPTTADGVDAISPVAHDMPKGRLRAVGQGAKSAVQLGCFFVANRSSIGAQAWQIGWHLGHRS